MLEEEEEIKEIPETTVENSPSQDFQEIPFQENKEEEETILLRITLNI